MQLNSRMGFGSRLLNNSTSIWLGLKELLISHGFTIEQLAKMKSSDIAETNFWDRKEVLKNFKGKQAKVTVEDAL